MHNEWKRNQRNGFWRQIAAGAIVGVVLVALFTIADIIRAAL